MIQGTMKEADIIRAVMKETGTTQVTLTELLGYGHQSSVSGRINSPRMSVERFSAMIDAMGYEVVVREKQPVTGSEWVVLADKKNA